jgi:hypothetical protein
MIHTIDSAFTTRTPWDELVALMGNLADMADLAALAALIALAKYKKNQPRMSCHSQKH